MATDYSSALTQQPNQITQPTSDYSSALPNPSTYDVPQTTPVQGYGGVLLSSIAPVVDFISRPQYASAKFFDSLGNESRGIFGSLGDAFSELIDPKNKLSFSDVIAKAAPGFAKESPTSTKVLGFLLDVALDPTTYLGVGFGSKGLKIGGKVLSEVGKEAITKGVTTAARETFTNRGALELSELIAKEAAKKKPNFVKIGKLGQELESTGYKSAVDAKLLEIGDFATGIGAQSDTNLFRQLAVDEVQQDLKRNVLDRTTKLAASEVRERVEERILRLSETNKDVAIKLFESPKGIRLTAGIPFTSLEKDIPYSAEAIRYIGLEPTKILIDSLKKIPVAGKAIQGIEDFGSEFGKQFKGLFVRPQDEPFKKTITKLENQLDFISDDIIRTTQKLFKDIPEERRILIGRTMREIDDASRLEEEELLRNLTSKESDRIYKRILGENDKLIPEDRAIIARLQQGYKEAMELEMEAGLLKQGKANYNPRVYQILDDPTIMTAYSKQKIGLSTYLPSSQERFFKTLNEAELAGFTPEMDAAMLYAQRMLSSRRALSVRQFQDSIKDIYGIPDKIAWGSKEMSKFFPNKKIIDDMRLLGESVYPSGMNESMRYFLQGFDKLTSAFRKGATVLKPSFAPKQFISNTVQAVLEQGTGAFKAFDPRVFMDSALIISDVYRNKPKGSQLPPFLNKLFNSSGGPDGVLASRVALSRILGEEKLLNFADEFSKTSVLGEKISGRELVNEMREYGIIKGFDATGERFAKSVEDGLRFDPNSKSGVTKELLKYWKFPSIAEDYGRSVAYINARTMGYSPTQAANQVNKALFDYSRGLTSFEKNVARRIIPFYTYQRFAIPFVLRKLVERPGTVSSGQKIVSLMEKLMVDKTEQLTPAEREIFGDSFLIEQPRLFSGFDNTGKAKFNVFNNMTPLDALSFFAYDKSGNLDLERTAQKTVLAALTPFIKVPLESAIDKNFFTGRTITEGGKLGDLSNGVSMYLPNVVKQAIGWEDRTNMRTGKTQTYINPYLAYYTFSAIPALKQFIQPLDAGKSALDGAMSFITGIVPSGIDLKEAQEFQQLGEQAELNKLKSNIRLGVLRGSKNQYEQAQEEYQEYIKTLMTKRQAPGEVRGQGIQPGLSNQPEVAQDQR